MSSGEPPNQRRLVITVTESIRSFLLSVSNDLRLSQELRELALTLFSCSSAPYVQIRSIWIGSFVDSKPGLISLLSISNFVLYSPKPREKSEELTERLRKLEETAERKEYQELVKDITPKKDLDEPFSLLIRINLALDSSFLLFLKIKLKDLNEQCNSSKGLHVALTMFTGYLVGYLAFRAFFNRSPIMNAAGGILGLVFGMLLETLLFIIRTSDYGLKSPPSTYRLK